MNLDNKVIAITGGARGIGQAIALKLAAAGAKLAILDLDQAALDEVLGLIEAEGSQGKGYICNVAEEAAVEETFKQIVSDFGTIDGLVNNAGIIRDGLLIKAKDGKVVSKMSTEQFDLVIDVHLKGAFLCTREAVAHMIELGVEEGCIVNMSSGAFRGNFGQTNYSAAKAGIVAMNRTWSKELSRYNIRSMAIAPGTIDTDLLRSMPEHALKKLTDMVPLGRVGTPDHIAQTVNYIFENDYLTGSVIDVHGGFLF